MKLSERIRPDVDAAPWVVRAVQALESQVEIAESFHLAAVAERNSAWTEIERLKSAAQPAAAASGWEIRRSVNHEGEICVVAPNCDPGAARISYGGRLENRLLYRLAEAMLAAANKENNNE